MCYNILLDIVYILKVIIIFASLLLAYKTLIIQIAA